MGNDALFNSRSRFIAGGFYAELVEAIRKLLPEGPILDAGCGEGSFLKAVCPDTAARPCLGLDLSRPGIQRAARGGGWLWAVGDLSRLPLADGSMAAILNILSPANYLAPLSREFFRQEYWSGLPFPPPWDLTNTGIKPVSPALAGRFFTTESPRKPPLSGWGKP